MKKLIILVCLIASNLLIAYAQPPRPTRPAKPDTNTGQSKPRPSRDEITSSLNYKKELITEPFIFKKGEVSLSLDPSIKGDVYLEAIAKSDAVIAEYLAAVDKFLATNPNMSLYANDLSRVRNKAKILEGDYGHIKNAEKALKSGISAGQVSYLQNLYLYKGFLQGVTKIYPDDEPLQNYLKMVTEAIESFGSREKFLEKMEANYKNMTKNMRMIPARMSNPKIESMVKTRFEATFKEFKVTKVNITYTTWIIDKNDLGIPLMRKLSVSVGVKNAKGECGIGSANVGEDYQGGGSYGQAYMYLPSDPIIVPCENIK